MFRAHTSHCSYKSPINKSLKSPKLAVYITITIKDGAYQLPPPMFKLSDEHAYLLCKHLAISGRKNGKLSDKFVTAGEIQVGHTPTDPAPTLLCLWPPVHYRFQRLSYHILGGFEAS